MNGSAQSPGEPTHADDETVVRNGAPRPIYFVAVLVLFSAAITAAPFGLPIPVHASQPAAALNAPLLPCVMSWKAPGVL